MYAGNSVVVNFLMRWPVLIPIAVAATVITVVPTPVKKEVLPPPPPVQVVVPPVPAPVIHHRVMKSVESLCPPVEKTKKLSKKDKKVLRNRGCKVKG